MDSWVLCAFFSGLENYCTHQSPQKVPKMFFKSFMYRDPPKTLYITIKIVTGFGLLKEYGLNSMLYDFVPE